MIRTIQVTQSDIDSGRRGMCGECPVANAVTRTLGAPALVPGDNRLYVAHDDESRVHDVYSISRTVQETIATYDMDGEMFPFTFDMALVGEESVDAGEILA